MDTRIIAVLTESGLMARSLSALRPDQQIIALTSSRAAMHELALIWGIEPTMIRHSKSTEELLQLSEKTLLEAGLVEKGETIVLMAGRLFGLRLSSSVTVYKISGVSGEDDGSVHLLNGLVISRWSGLSPKTQTK